MSGIIGIFQRDGKPVEHPLLAALTNFLSFRGPDAQEVWLNGAIGFGHTMLRTTREAAHERQPASLGSDFCVTADVRLDCRAELIETLTLGGCRFDSSCITDPELILHAYATWREACIDHLRGDFAFALWDQREHKLFCARDHFGIKPLFYTATHKQFLFSNTLNCLRAHPGISDELNEAAIGDFLLFGLNCEIATTTFQDIHRLPPAHFLVVTRDGLRTQRYWSLPIDGRIRYARPEEYVENFRELLKAAVADRLRTDRVGIFLSGGLDSGSIAAMVRELRESSTGSKNCQAYTTVFKSSFRDEEGSYAEQTAHHLQIPQRLLNLDGIQPFDRWNEQEYTSPEPTDTPFFAALVGIYRELSAEQNAVLSGEGGDNLTRFQMAPYAKDLLKRSQWRELVRETMNFLWVRPFPWRGIGGKLPQFRNKAATKFPDWIAGKFSERSNLQERWSFDPTQGSEDHPLLPKACASLTNPYWNLFFELEDPGATRTTTEVRYPFLDLRVVNYLLSITPFPWLFDKKIFRDAMRTRLPEEIRTRPKSPLASKTVKRSLNRKMSLLRNELLTSEIDAYVDRSRVPQVLENQDLETSRVVIRVYCLSFWLQSALRLEYKVNGEDFAWTNLRQNLTKKSTPLLQ